MKKIILLLAVLLAVPFLMPCINGCLAQNVGINSTGAVPDTSAMLDIVSTNKGMLVPRVALTATNSASPVTLPATSLVVYNTATAGTSPNNVIPGFYYWNGTQWVQLLNYGDASGADWSLTGNAGTTASGASIGSTVTNNFIGTTGATDFVIASDNLERMRIRSGGSIGIGVTNSTSLLQVGSVATTLAAPTTTGAWLGIPAATVTDNSTGNATVATGTFTSLGIPTYASSTATTTVTHASNLYIAGAPVAGTNAAFTNSSALRIAGGASSGTNAYGLYVDVPTGATNNYAAAFNTGNVGIGTTAPAVALHVVGNIRNSNLAGGGTVVVEADNNGTLNPLTAGSATQVLLGTGGWGSVPGGENDWSLTGNAGTTASGASIGSTVTNNFIGTTGATDFVFATTNLERIRIRSGGSVGIGVTNSTSLLQIGSVATAAAAPTTSGAWLGIPAATFTDNSTAASGTAATGTFTALGIPTYATTNTGTTVTHASNLYIAGAPVAGSHATLTNSSALRIAGGASSGTNAYGLFVDVPTGATNNYAAAFNTGNVGIGTASPAYALDVVGQTRSTMNGGGSTAAFIANGSTGPAVAWDVNGQGTDQKLWDLWANATEFVGRAVNDANTFATDWLWVTRGSGFTIGDVGFPSGNVGIGYLAPGNKFSVGITYNTGTVGLSSTTVTGSGTAFTAAMVGGTITISTGAPINITAVGSGTSLTVAANNQTNWAAGGFSYTITYPGGLEVTSAGLVGIGTTSPAYNLDVVGQGRFTKNGGGSGAAVFAAGSNPAHAWNNTAVSGTNTSWWDLWATGTTFNGRAINDANTLAADWLTVTRNASTYTIGTVVFPNGNVGVGATPTSLLQVGSVATTAAAPTTTGAWLGIPAATFTDNSTGNATVTTGTFTSLGIPTYASSTATTTVTHASNLYIAGAPVAGTNAAFTNSSALRIAAGASSGTNAYGLYVDVPTGATNNYAASFNTGNVGIGTAAPAATLQVTGSLTSSGGTISLNGTTGNTTTIGNGTNTLTENGNVSINVANGSATTNIANGGTTGNVDIGCPQGYVGIRYNSFPASDIAPLDINAYIHFTGNVTPYLSPGGTSPAEPDLNQAGSFLCQNVLAGTGETDFFNNVPYASVNQQAGGFTFWNILQPSGTSNDTTGFRDKIPVLYIAGAGSTHAGNVSIGSNGLPWEGGISGGGAPSNFCTAPNYTLTVTGTIGASGTIYCPNALSNSFTACSDIRFKKDVTPLCNSLTNILKLQGVNYFWKTKEFPDRHFNDDKQIGLIAQEIEKILPELVFTDKDGYKSVDYSKLTPVLVEAIKEQQKMIDSLKADNGNLDGKVQQLEIGTKNLELKIGQLESEIGDVKNLLAPPVKKLTASGNN